MSEIRYTFFIGNDSQNNVNIGEVFPYYMKCSFVDYRVKNALGAMAQEMQQPLKFCKSSMFGDFSL